MNTNRPSQCRHLRTKKTYVPDFDAPESWRGSDSTTQQYWCLCTMTTAGPDDALVAPERCQPERECFLQGELHL